MAVSGTERISEKAELFPELPAKCPPDLWCSVSAGSSTAVPCISPLETIHLCSINGTLASDGREMRGVG